MKSADHFDTLHPPTVPRDVRDLRAARLNVDALERFLGKPLDLSKKRWEALIKRLSTFTGRDWKRVRKLKREAVPELARKR